MLCLCCYRLNFPYVFRIAHTELYLLLSSVSFLASSLLFLILVKVMPVHEEEEEGLNELVEQLADVLPQAQLVSQVRLLKVRLALSFSISTHCAR